LPTKSVLFLEDRQATADPLLADLLLGVDLEVFEDPLPGLVEDDQLARRRTLGGRVLGMAARVLIETSAVLEEDVQEMLGRDQLLEQEADRLLDRQGLATLGSEDDPVLGLDAVDALLHKAA
jgi:hypothetical protein